MPTIEVAVAAATDNAVEKDNFSGFTVGGANATVYSDTDSAIRSRVGLRFLPLFPEWATVVSAKLRVHITESKAPLDDPNLAVRVHQPAGGSSPDFVDQATVIGRTLGGDTSWSATDLGTGWVESPDFASAVNSVNGPTARDDDGAITVVLWGVNAADGGDLQIDLYESGFPPVLIIEYELLPRVVAATGVDGAVSQSVEWDAGVFARTKPGDLLEVVTALAQQATTLTPPTTNGAWNELTDSPQISSAHRMSLHWRWRALSEASETWTRGTGDVSHIFRAIRFADPSNPIYGADGDNGGAGTDSTPPSPALVDAKAGDLDIRDWSTDDRAATTWTTPSGYSAHAQVVTASRNQMLGVSKRVTVDGTQPSVDATNSAADQWASFTHGIRKIRRRPQAIMF